MHFPSLVESDFDFHLKIILLGDSGVGKSCMLKSFMGKEFTEGYVSTIGVDFEMKQTTVGGKKVNLQIWDTAGQERFRTITTSYYRSCDAILVVFDISDSTSFDNVELWLEDVRSYAKPDVDVILIGNKVDLYLERKVPFETAKRFADNSGMSYIETSAKSHFNVEKAFNTAASYACSKRLKEIAGAEKQGVERKAAQLEVEKEQKRASCC
mmetsp:Transcript_32303/g.52354  ORF Transcript_32303/g.52354 Transcript_32303/m.52354 type:complete len:211 (-) Transcript_32303:149-781(-)